MHHVGSPRFRRDLGPTERGLEVFSSGDSDVTLTVEFFSAAKRCEVTVTVKWLEISL